MNLQDATVHANRVSVGSGAGAHSHACTPPHVAVLLCTSLCRARQRGMFHPASPERAFKADRAERSKEPVLPGPAGGRPACPLPPTAETLHSPVLRLRSPRQEPACSLDAGLRQPPRSRTKPPYSRTIVQPSYSRTQRSHSRTQPSCSRTQPSCSSTIPHTLEPYFSRYYTVRLELSFFVCFFNVLFLKKYY